MDCRASSLHSISSPSCCLCIDPVCCLQLSAALLIWLSHRLKTTSWRDKAVSCNVSWLQLRSLCPWLMNRLPLKLTKRCAIGYSCHRWSLIVVEMIDCIIFHSIRKPDVREEKRSVMSQLWSLSTSQAAYALCTSSHIKIRYHSRGKLTKALSICRSGSYSPQQRAWRIHGTL